MHVCSCLTCLWLKYFLFFTENSGVNGCCIQCHPLLSNTDRSLWISVQTCGELKICHHVLWLLQTFSGHFESCSIIQLYNRLYGMADGQFRITDLVHNCKENPTILVSCNSSAILNHKILTILVSCNMQSRNVLSPSLDRRAPYCKTPRSQKFYDSELLSGCKALRSWVLRIFPAIVNQLSIYDARILNELSS